MERLNLKIGIITVAFLFCVASTLSNIKNAIQTSTTTDFPLKVYNDLCFFKIYMNDVGLLRKMAI